jgi:Domain of unknown function (DUF4350)
MPSSLSSGDRKVLLIAGAAFVILVVLGFLLAPTNNESSAASTYSIASEGAKAAFLLLQETGYHVERWQRPVRELKPDKHTVLIIADPPVTANQQGKTAIENFITGGGRLITNGMIGASLLPEDSSEYNALPHTPWSDFNALAPSAITRAAPKITLSPVAHWSQSSGIQLYGTENETVAVRIQRGEGDAIWLASATPFTNAGIKETTNLEFLLAAIGDKQQTRILFDEYVHGYGERSIPEKRHPIMTALLVQSLVLALTAVFTFSRRSGPLRPLAVEPRLAPLEFVETLGGLYRQARAGSVAVDVSYQRFQYWITRRLGLAANASPEDLTRAVSERWKWEDDTFARTLHEAAAARYHPDLPQKEALSIVQSLYSYAMKLKLFPSTKEKS